MTQWKNTATMMSIFATIAIAASQGAPSDPGPRPGPASAGGFYPTLNATEQAAFANGISQFTEEEGVIDDPPGNGGLGPGYNSNSCGSCHSQPATLGSSTGPSSPQAPQPNPQIAAAAADGATNSIPSFITANGPVREARFVKQSDGTPDGGVHNLFSIAGRSDAPGCNLKQPDFAAQLAAHNVVFRIPTPLFGLGLVENTPDYVFRVNLDSTAKTRAELGIGGRFNTSANDGTIMKFGWKAQNKSLTIFAGEAYNVEMGITNDVMSNERNMVRGCLFNATPEDQHSQPGGSDVDQFVDAMRLSAPPTPVSPTAHTKAGHDLFADVGCVLCHSESLTTSSSYNTGMSNVQYHPFSDFALHHMGANLADGVAQGVAGPDEFRTAPLWGIGQRLFFLHDGRASDLLTAIEQHSSQGSEANAVVRRFNSLSPERKQAVLDFLRSL
ncbi:MAG: di-heme oxidoredictase family protein [Terriglobales bacterium]